MPCTFTVSTRLHSAAAVRDSGRGRRADGQLKQSRKTWTKAYCAVPMCEAMVLSWRTGPTPISPADIWQMSGDNFDSHNLGEGVVILASSEQRPEMQLNILKFIGQLPNNKDLGSPKCQQG